MKNIIRICNLTVRFLKFTLNIKIYEKFVEFLFKLLRIEILYHCVTHHEFFFFWGEFSVHKYDRISQLPIFIYVTEKGLPLLYGLLMPLQLMLTFRFLVNRIIEYQ